MLLLGRDRTSWENIPQQREWRQGDTLSQLHSQVFRLGGAIRLRWTSEPYLAVAGQPQTTLSSLGWSLCLAVSFWKGTLIPQQTVLSGTAGFSYQ